jgi:hypothetical protein
MTLDLANICSIFKVFSYPFVILIQREKAIHSLHFKSRMGRMVFKKILYHISIITLVPF